MGLTPKANGMGNFVVSLLVKWARGPHQSLAGARFDIDVFPITAQFQRKCLFMIDWLGPILQMIIA